MPTVELNLTGGTYKHKSLPLSAQVTRNFYPQLIDNPKARSQYILTSYPGKKFFGAQSGGTDRGMFVHKGTLYKVTGEKLYSVASDGTHTELGDITGTERCVFAGIGDNVVIVSNGSAWQYNGSSVSVISDGDLETPNACAHLNNQVIYDGDGGRFAVSDVGDATSIDPLNYATAESNADDIVRPYTFKQVLYLFGEDSIERWWNSGQGNPPFDRFQGGITQVGLAALHSVANDDDNIYFLANDNQVYSIRGSSSSVIEPLLPEPMVREFGTYGRVSDAIGYCLNLNGQWIYVLTFPFSDKTWALPIGGEWFELSSGANGGRDIGNSYVYFNRKHLLADHRNGNIYELDDNTYTDNSEEIIRVRHTGPIHGGLFDAPGKRIEMSRFELIMETGIGTLEGQGQDPVVMLSFSDDGGRTFSSEMWATVGRLGQFMWKVEWFALGSFENRIISIETSDPNHYAIYSAAADIEVGI